MRTAHIVAGLAFGDEGKGATVDFLCRQRYADLVVRYNGGSQAGHNVVTPDGLHHTFAQFGSGTFIPGVRTHLSRFMLVNPINMGQEDLHLRKIGVHDAFTRLTVDEKCLIVTPMHRAINRLIEESRGEARHGSCGQGIGQCRLEHLKHGEKVLFAGDLRDHDTTIKKLRFIQREAKELSDFITKANPFLTKDDFIENGEEALENLWDYWYRDWPAKIVKASHLEYLMATASDVVFEGAQGVLLDETHGSAPHNTWTNTTFENALTLLAENNFDGKIHKIGVLRTYFTRHGAGPFRTEDNSLKPALPEPHNDDKGYQGAFRVGYTDYGAINYAIKVCNGVDGIALNHLDTHAAPALAYFVKKMETITNTPVWIESYGLTANDRHWRKK
jgi:adenylosuccinate synthase